MSSSPTPSPLPELHHSSPTTQSPASNTASDDSLWEMLSYMNSGNPCLDFFHLSLKSLGFWHISEEALYNDHIQRLQRSWQFSPLTTLKLIANLRAVRGSGKNNPDAFYAAALWLHQNHPKTLALNVGPLSGFGSLKDPLEILFRILEGGDVRKRLKSQWKAKKYSFHLKLRTTMKKPRPKKGKALKAEKKAKKAKKVTDRCNHDPEYKLLFDCVCDVFACLLRKDLELLRQGDNVDGISLAAKWCPSLDSSYDKYLLICESIARRVFPREECREYDGVEEAHYVYKVRARLRKEVLVPLRSALELPEVYMCGNRWRDIKYDRVGTAAMNRRKYVFMKRDWDGFEEYTREVRDGESTIAAGAMLPHEIIEGFFDPHPKAVDVAVLQWKRLVGDLAKERQLINWTALANNVNEFDYLGMLMLVSELTNEPWKGKLITYSQEPELYKVEGEDVYDKVMNIWHCMPNKFKVDLQKVFDRILDFTVEEKLSEDKMLRRVFVFVEEGFPNMCVHHFGETEYDEVKRKFLDRGVQRVPEIVFWNLDGSTTVPVRCDHPGIVVVSGLSKNLLTLFLDDDGGPLTTETVMNAAISGPEYDQLVVYD